MPGAEPSRSTHRDSGKQKGSSKTVNSNFREAFTNRFAVGLELGPSGTRRLVNHKARGRRSQPREDTASLASDRSNGSRGATRSVIDANGFAEGVHAAGVLPGNAHPDNMHPGSVHEDSVHQGSVPQDINGRRQPSGDTASVASGKSNKSTGTRRRVNNGSGPTRSVHPGPGSGSQDTVGGGQAVGDAASVTSRKSSTSTKSKHSVRSGQSRHSTGTRRNVDNGNGSAGGELPGSVHRDSGGGGGGGGEAGAEGSGEEEGHGRGEDHDGGGGGGEAGAEGSGEEGLGREEDHDGGEVGGGKDGGAEGLGEEEEGHGRAEDHDGGEVGGGNDDGGTEVVGEGQGAGADENARTSDAEQALAGIGNDDTGERDLSEQRAVEGRHVGDDHAGTGEGAIVGERDGDGDGEENTCRIIVVWERK